MNIKFNFNIDVDVNVETEEIKAVTELLQSLDKKDLAQILTKSSNSKKALEEIKMTGERIDKDIKNLNRQLNDVKKLTYENSNDIREINRTRHRE